MKKAVFLDRDGTINVEKNYLYKIEEFEYLPKAIDGLKILQDLGYILIIITNQSGIARGYYTENDYKILNEWMNKDLMEKGIKISETYYCPHHPDAKIFQYKGECNCRKPKLGLYSKAIEKYNIDLNNSYAIGDKIRDCSICKETPCKGFLINENEDDAILQSVKAHYYSNIRYAHDLYEASMIIRNDSTM